jgi:hypothetical protein
VVMLCRALSLGAWHWHRRHSGAGEQRWHNGVGEQWWHNGVKGPDDVMRWDMMAQGGRRTGGQRCGIEVAMGGWHNSGNRGSNASESVAGEDLGEEGPTGGSWLPVTEARAW